MADETAKAKRWQKREHDVVFRALDRGLSGLSFPASRGRIAREAGGTAVSDESTLPLLKYIEALPDRMYESAEDVKNTLDDRWQDLLSYRNAGYEANLERGGGGAG